MTILFLLLSLRVFAPGESIIYIENKAPLNKYDRLIKAIVLVESNGDHNAINHVEMAVGAFQIRQIRIDHFNSLTGKNYTLQDCFDYEVSKEVFMYFTKNRSYELVAKSWNGSGPMTIEYWNKVKSKL